MTTQPADDYMMDEWVRPETFHGGGDLEVDSVETGRKEGRAVMARSPSCTLVHPRTPRVPALAA